MAYEHVREIVRPMGNGCTNPLLAQLEDGTFVVIKLFNNIEGNKTLINELICYKLARALDLLIPYSRPCIVDTSTVDDLKLLDPINYGVCFASNYLEKSGVLNPLIIKKLTNLTDFCKLLIFDHLIYNKDRNAGNLLTRFKKNDLSFYLIDHTHVFKNETIWDQYCFITGIKIFDVNDLDILNANQHIYSMFFQCTSITKALLVDCSIFFKERITQDLLKEILDSIPNEWGMTTVESTALLEYLLYRLENLNSIVELIIKNH